MGFAQRYPWLWSIGSLLAVIIAAAGLAALIAWVFHSETIWRTAALAGAAAALVWVYRRNR